MKRLAAIAAVVVACGACGSDSGDKAVAATTTAAPLTTTTAVPPDSQTPAAGACANAAGGVAAITLNPDIPSPRCIVVHDTDRLKVTNKFDVAVFVDDGAGGFNIGPGKTYEAVKAVGGYWQPGVHRLKISNQATHAALYGGSGPEVWLK